MNRLRRPPTAPGGEEQALSKRVGLVSIGISITRTVKLSQPQELLLRLERVEAENHSLRERLAQRGRLSDDDPDVPTTTLQDDKEDIELLLRELESRKAEAQELSSTVRTSHRPELTVESFMTS